MLTRENVLGALARGYCTKENEHKELDATLCNAMADEILRFIAPAAAPAEGEEHKDD